MLRRMAEYVEALVRGTYLANGASGRAARASIATFAGIVLAVAALLLVPILSAQAQEGAEGETKKDYAFLDGDPGQQSMAVGALREKDLDEDPEGNPYVTGELLIAYEQDTPQAAADEVNGEVGAKVLDRYSSLDSSLVHFPEIKAEESEEVRAAALERKKEELEADPKVAAVGYNHVREAGEAQPGATSNDPFFSSQWGLTRISAPEAWDTATGGGAVIAVLDSGIDPTHVDVGSKVDFSRGFCSPTDTSATDQNGHGTHVAGIAAANTDNSTGIAGAAPDARLQVGKVLCGPGAFATDGSIVAGIDWAVSAPAADVINMSIQGCGYNAAEEVAVNRAWNAGTVVVAIAGNWAEASPTGCGGPNPSVYPGAHDNAISVASVNIDSTRSNFSGFRSYVDVAAPGGSTAAGSTLPQQILSTYPVNFGNGSGIDGYEYLQGTSMAAPHVAGVAGLLASQGLSAPEIRQRIESTAADLGPVGRDNSFGHGLVNAEAAVTNSPPGDTLKPTGSVLINDGAIRTRSRYVRLLVDATDPLPGTGVQHVRASNDGIRWSPWTAFSPGTYNWTLAGKRAGTRTVYVQYRDGAGNISNSVLDTIRYAPRR